VSTAKSRNFVDRHFVGNAAQGAALHTGLSPLVSVSVTVYLTRPAH
jgi:hypothetical protein